MLVVVCINLVVNSTNIWLQMATSMLRVIPRGNKQQIQTHLQRRGPNFGSLFVNRDDRVGITFHKLLLYRLGLFTSIFGYEFSMNHSSRPPSLSMSHIPELLALSILLMHAALLSAPRLYSLSCANLEDLRPHHMHGMRYLALLRPGFLVLYERNFIHGQFIYYEDLIKEA